MKQQRELQIKELKKLDRQLKQSDKNYKRAKRVFLIWTLIAVALGTLALIKDSGGTAGIITFTALVGIGIWIFNDAHIKQQRTRESISFLKSKNLLTSVVVHSDKFYQLKEVNDEGEHYLFQLDNNSVFSFGGQDFYPRKKFPSDRFEIVEGRGINDEILLLEIYSSGNKVQPARVISGQEKLDLLANPNYPDPDKLTVVEGRIEDFVQQDTNK